MQSGRKLMDRNICIIVSCTVIQRTSFRGRAASPWESPINVVCQRDGREDDRPVLPYGFWNIRVVGRLARL